MYKIYNTLLIAIFLLLAISCSYDAELVDLPAFEKKLVIHCYISPSDSEIVAMVDYNLPVYEDSIWKYYDRSLSGIKIFLSDGEKEAQFSLKGDSFCLDAQIIPIKESKTYYLKVTDTLGNVATSQCTVPVFKEVDIQIDTSFYFIREDWGITKYVQFKDFIQTIRRNTYSYRYISYEHANEHRIIDSVQFNFIWKMADKLFFDGPTSGKSYNFNFDKYIYDYNSFIVDSIFYKFYILQLSNEYRNYYKSIENYNEVDSYFSEISPIYSNINGGLGIFCGYAQRVYTFKINKDMVEYK